MNIVNVGLIERMCTAEHLHLGDPPTEIIQCDSTDKLYLQN